MGRPKGSKGKKKADPIVEDAYRAAIKVFGILHEAYGQTAKEAISSLKVEKARGVTVLTLQKGTLVQEKILPKLATVRLFAPSKLVREVALKHTLERFSI